MKQKKAAVAVTAGLVGVLALGACSSGASDQAQDTSTPSASQSEHEAGGKQDNSGNVALPASKGGQFSNVVTTHAPETKCTRNEQKNDKNVDVLVLKCTNVVKSVIGSAVFVRLPGAHYQVAVTNDSAGQPGHRMMTSQMDVLDVELQWNTSENNPHIWDAPKRGNAATPWAVGVHAYQPTPINATVVVSKTS